MKKIIFSLLIICFSINLINAQINDVSGRNVIAKDTTIANFLSLRKRTTYPSNPRINTIINYKDTLKFWNGSTWKVLGESQDLSIYILKSDSSKNPGYSSYKALKDSSNTLRILANSKQSQLISGTNIKSINGSSILTSGDLSLQTSLTNPITNSGTGTANQLSYFTGANTIQGSQYATWDEANRMLKLNISGLASTTQQVIGIKNHTAATVGIPNQYSGYTVYKGQYWNTGGGTNNLAFFRTYLKTVSGNPGTYQLDFDTSSDSISWTNRFSFNNVGQLTLNNVVASSSVVVGTILGCGYNAGTEAIQYINGIRAYALNAASGAGPNRYAPPWISTGAVWDGSASHDVGFIFRTETSGSGGSSYTGLGKWYMNRNGTLTNFMTINGTSGAIGLGTTTIDSLLTINGGIHARGLLLSEDLQYKFMHIAASSDSITGYSIGGTQNVYYKINITSFTNHDSVGVSLAGDSIKIQKAGDYYLYCDMISSTVNANDQIRTKLYFNNVAAATSISRWIINSPGNIANAETKSKLYYLHNLAANTWISVRSANLSGNRAITISDFKIICWKAPE